MIDHPVRARVAEIIVARVGKEDARGSGYLVSPGWVLTACHVVDGAASIGVWLGAPSELATRAGVGVDIGRMVMVPAADLALLPVGGHVNDPPCEPALFGRLDRGPGPSVPVAAVGCPRFKLRPDRARPDILLRELIYAMGTIASLSDAKTDTYTLTVDVVPPLDAEPEKHSPWEGMSGAAVWGNGRLIGVIGHQYPREGPGTLTVRTIEQLFRSASEAELMAWHAALPQLPSSADGLWLATPPTVREIEVARARRAAEALAPRVLIGRSSELAALEAFTESSERWRWIQGDAFAGKTALLAWFAVHRPDRVDVAGCFLRRASGENTADYALDVLTRQLALLADRRGYIPPQYPSVGANDLVDLLDEAARACTERGRRLLVLIDGLDEYDPMSASFELVDWLPDATTLPNDAMVLVASRVGTDVRLPKAHPLFGNVQRITASDAASEIRHTARAELDRALSAPSGFVFPMACCIAVADAGLTSSELRTLLKRRGRDADISEIEALLNSSLNRSVMRVPDSDGVGMQVYVFAHDTLLGEARERFAADLSTYEDLFDEWADEPAQQNWPTDTPRYLLRPYSRELSRRARDAAPNARCRAAVDQLFMVVAHRSRLLRLFERTGNPAVPDQDIVSAQQTILDTRSRNGLDPDEVIFRLAVLVLRRRPLTGSKARIASDISTVWLRIGHINAAFGLAIGIDDQEQRAQALSRVSEALAQAGQPGPAADAAKQAQQAAACINDPQQRAQALSQVSEALAQAGQPGPAADAAKQARQAAACINDPQQRARTLSRVAEALAQCGRPSQALQAAAGIDNPQQQAQTLSRVAEALARAGQAGQALQAAVGIDDPEQRAQALSRVAEALAQCGRPSQALQAAAGIDNPWQIAALSRVAAALSRSGQLGPAADAARQALATAVGIDNPWERAEALSWAAEALAQAGQPGQAVQAAVGIDDPERRARTLSRVAETLAQARQPGPAADAARQALQAAIGIDHPERRARVLSLVTEALNLVTAALSRSGEPGLAADAARQAVQAATGIDDPWQRAQLLSRVALASSRSGQPGPAADAAGKALQAAIGIHEPLQRAEALSKVAAALSRSGESGPAADVARQALATAAGIDNSWQRAQALKWVAEALAQAGQPGQAAQAAAGIDDPEQRAEALSKVAAALSRSGESGPAADVARQALATAAGIDNSWQRAQALKWVAEALAQAGQPGQAAQAAAGIDDPEQRAEALSRAAAALAQAGQAGPAADAAKQALQAATGIDYSWQRAEALSKMAEALALAGEPGQAAQAAAGIGDPGQRAEALSRAAAALARCGHVVCTWFGSV